MIDFVWGWRDWIAVALISSALNLLVAYGHFHKRCRYLPFLNPWSTLGVWWWFIVQLALPGAAFWFLYSLSSRPPINFDLVTKAITFGLVFTALAHAYVDTGFFGVNIKDFYTVLTEIAYKQIAASQTRNTAAFWTDFQQTLTKGNQDLFAGLDYLRNYFSKDVSLDEQTKQSYISRINDVQELSSRAEQVIAITSLLDVRRKDLPEILRRFQISEALYRSYSAKK